MYIEILVIRVMDSRLANPFICIVFGPTGSGKSVFTLKLVEHAQEISSPPPERILFYYGEYPKKYFITFPQWLSGSYISRQIAGDELLWWKETNTFGDGRPIAHHGC